jgi:hypothetical protein
LLLLAIAATAADGEGCLGGAEEKAQELLEQAATEVAKQQTAVPEREPEGDSYKGIEFVNGTSPLPWGKEKRIFIDVLESMPPKFYADPAPLDTVKRVGFLTSPVGAWAVYFHDEQKIEIAAFNAAVQPSEDYLGHVYAHELAHVLQSYNPATGREYDCIPENDLVREYGMAVGYVINRFDCATGGGDAEDNRDTSEIPPYSDPSDDCAGKVCIWEDMADAIGMYVIESEKLRSLSRTRYDFIKQYVFDGEEY